MKQLIQKVANRWGYDFQKLSPATSNRGYELFQYRNSDGSFDYQRYRQIQSEGNKRKIENIWVKEENIEFLAKFIRRTLGDVSFGLCHGTRRGMEQKWFRQYLDCEVLGTEISDTAEQFPDTIQWDFHEVKPEWIDSVDFVYSNSFDHSYDPMKCINAWMSCVKPNGLCILEHTSCHEQASELDPFGADITIMPYLILTWSEGKFCVSEILDAPADSDALAYVQYLLIRKNT